MKLHSKTAKLAVICIGLWSLPASTRAQALAIPTVAQLPANAPPAAPAGMKVTCTQGPGNAAPSPTCPVLKWQGFTYWAFSYVDNRFAMGIVAYDSAGKAVAQWEKPGDRYVHAITVDAARKNVTFAGQAGPKISMTWDELTVSPTVTQVPANAPPAVPAGMKVTCTQGPGNAAPSPTCPVLKWQGFTYWAFSYVDNRLAMGIVAYDSAGKAVAQWEKPGDRYVYAITVDAAHKSVTFAGQAGPKISMTWAELEVSPAPAAGDRCSPAIPNNAGAAAVCNPVCSASGLTFAGNWSCDNGAATACRSKGQGACVCGCRQSQAPETPRTDKK